MRWIFILLIFSVSCNRIELDYYSVQESQSDLDPISSFDSQGRRKDVLLTRSPQKKFEEKFISSKLDMVFLLDTHKTRASFYSKDFLGYDFLNFFYNYNWRLAWTDMSLDIQALEKKTKQDKSKSKCGFLSNLIMAIGGIFTNAHRVSESGLEGLSDCISRIDLSSDEKESNSYANGSFLPFESNKKTYYLSESNPHSSAILYNSLILPNPKDKAYKAPILRENKSFPLLSMIFALSKNLYTKKKVRFFREDSLVVFVLFSLGDSKSSVPAEVFKESLSSAFGSYDRFKLILVTLTDQSHVFCPLYHEEDSKTPKKLLKLVKELDQPVLDICSQNLGEEIFNEVSKGLSPENLL